MSSKIVAATLISKNNVTTTGVKAENLFDRSKILIINSSYEVLVLDDANAVDENVDIKVSKQTVLFIYFNVLFLESNIS